MVRKGDTILNMNYAAVDRGVDGAVKVEIPVLGQLQKIQKLQQQERQQNSLRISLNP